jgi:RNA recognition motif-containing protein
MNIYVGNLSYKMKADNLKALFAEFGEVKTAKVIMDRYSGRSKGFGFVEMPDNSEADQAIKALNGKFIEGENIKVNPADPGGKRAKKKRAFKQRRYNSSR